MCAKARISAWLGQGPVCVPVQNSERQRVRLLEVLMYGKLHKGAWASAVA